MLFISKHGHVDAERVKLRIFPAIERGSLDRVNGIIVHQTNGPTVNSVYFSEVYRHPEVSYKQETEASTAQW